MAINAHNLPVFYGRPIDTPAGHYWVGGTYQFRPTATDPSVTVAAGTVAIVATVGDTDSEVGPMYRVRNVETGAETDAYSDELTPDA